MHTGRPNTDAGPFSSTACNHKFVIGTDVVELNESMGRLPISP